MTFDDAITLVMGNGVAAKTTHTLGYIRRKTVGDSFFLEFRRRSEYYPPRPSDIVTYPVEALQNGDLSASDPLDGTGEPMSPEFMEMILSDDWYTCTEAECEEACSKTATRFNDPVRFTALEPDATVSFGCFTNMSSLQVHVSYSVDEGITWTPMNIGSTTATRTEVLLPNVGSSVLIQVTDGYTNTKFATDSYNTYRFIIKGRVAASGDLTSMLSTLISARSQTLPNNCFMYLFGKRMVSGSYSNTGLTSAPKMPFTSAGTACFYGMFDGCSSLESVPDMRSLTSGANWCFRGMFNGCSSLVDISGLPPLTSNLLTNWSYSCESMFEGCSSLAVAPALPVTLQSNQTFAYKRMFAGCTSLVAAPALPSLTLTEGCYSEMFKDCTSLVNAPALPATTLAERCYYGMFDGCTSLATAPDLPASTINSEECYFRLFAKCRNLISIRTNQTSFGASALGCCTQWVYVDEDPQAELIPGVMTCKPALASLISSLGKGPETCPTFWTIVQSDNPIS